MKKVLKFNKKCVNMKQINKNEARSALKLAKMLGRGVAGGLNRMVKEYTYSPMWTFISI